MVGLVMAHVPCMPLQTCYVREMSNEIAMATILTKQFAVP
jgi:hypothetical protein